MDVVVGPDRCRAPAAGSAVTIGAYDGVHLGHRQLIAQLRAEAEQRGLETVVVTFDRHPATVVRPRSAPLLLTDLAQKLELLASTGVDRTLVVPFDDARAAEPPSAFIDEVLVRALDARLVVVGSDFHFGRDRAGNVSLLVDAGREQGFDVVGATLTAEAGTIVSSTRIRACLASGDVVGAARLLGRPHQLRGPVVTGDGRGASELGYPTANVAVPAGMALPAEGIYACWYERPDGSVHPAATSLGRRPTFYAEAEPVLEVHLIDFSGDLYGEEARVDFVERLRPETRFDTVDALVAQIDRDVADARRLLDRP